MTEDKRHWYTKEPLIHSHITDRVPEDHPYVDGAFCDKCGAHLHSVPNECMQTWVETEFGNFCTRCFKFTDVMKLLEHNVDKPIFEYRDKRVITKTCSECGETMTDEKMTLALQDCLWDILESEAFERYFIGDAEKPAFLILNKYNPLSNGAFELYINYVARLGRFQTHKKAVEKLDMVLSGATKKIHVFKQRQMSMAKFDKKVLYATIDPTLPIKPREKVK